MAKSATGESAGALASRSDRLSEIRLLERWQRVHDERAREELIRRYQPLVRKLVLRYHRSSEAYEDLMQVGNLALLKAIERFDPAKGARFIGFAVPTVLGELRRHFRDTGWSIHVARGIQERAMKVEEAQRVLTERHGRSPSVAQVAQYLEMSQEDVIDALQAWRSYDTLSLDAPRRREEVDETVGDSLGTLDGGFEFVEDRSTVAQAMKHMPERERRILYMRFFGDLTQTEIAARVGLSQMQISRLLRSSLEQLRGESEGESPRAEPS